MKTTNEYQVKKGEVSFHLATKVDALAKIKELVDEQKCDISEFSVDRIVATDIKGEFLDEDGKLLDTTLGIFIQIERSNNAAIRYIAVGEMDSDGLTGMLYGYVGGGEYDSGYVINGRAFPDVENGDEEDMDNDEIEELFTERTSSAFFNACNELLYTYAQYEGENYFMTPTDALLSLPREDEVVFTHGADIVPVDYGNTYW